MEQYLDNPVFDDTPRAHPAFWRGKSTGINAVLKIVADVMNGVDDGSGTNNHEQIERMRRALFTWKERVDASFKESKGGKSGSKVEKED